MRITKEQEEPSCVTLKVEGRLVSEWVALVEAECAKCLQETATVLLDLKQVMFVDSPGIAMLKRLADNPVQLVNTPAFIADLYTAERPLSCEPSDPIMRHPERLGQEDG